MTTATMSTFTSVYTPTAMPDTNSIITSANAPITMPDSISTGTHVDPVVVGIVFTCVTLLLLITLMTTIYFFIHKKIILKEIWK